MIRRDLDSLLPTMVVRIFLFITRRFPRRVSVHFRKARRSSTKPDGVVRVPRQRTFVLWVEPIIVKTMGPG